MPVRSAVAASRSAHSRGGPTGCSPQSSSVYASGSRIARARPSTVTWASRPCCSQPGIALVSVSTASARRSAIWHDAGRDMGRAGDLLRRTARRARVRAPQRDHLRLLLVPAVHARAASAARARRPAGRSPARCRRRRPRAPAPAPSGRPRPRHDRRPRGRRTAPRGADTGGSRSQRSSRSSDSGKPLSYASSPAPKTSRSTHGPPRPTPSVNRPPEVRCSSAACSPSATGCAVGSTLTAVPTRIRRVRPSSSAASVTADGQTPYGTKWCSASQTASSPASSATSADRTARCSASPCPWPGNWAASTKRSYAHRLLPPWRPTRLPHWHNA